MKSTIITQLTSERWREEDGDMILATIVVDGVSAVPAQRKKIPAGLIGAEVRLEFDRSWQGLTKTVVFQAVRDGGAVTKDVRLGEEEMVKIPWEVVERPSRMLRVGLYGTNVEGDLVIPTLWAELGRVYYAADPSGDESTAPSLPVWAQLQQQMDELKQSGGPGGGTGKDGGYYTPTVTQPSENKLEFVFTPSNEDMPAVQPVQVTLPAGQGSGGNVDHVGVEPAKMDRPLVFFGAPLQQTKDEAVTTFSYRSKTLSFDCYAEIKAQGNSTLNWPKKNQTVKLYKDAACTEKYKVDFKGWGKQNKFVMKANWRDLTHVRDIVSVRLEGDCMRSNPDFEELPELLRTSPNLGGIDGFPVAVYAAGIYQGRYMWNIPKDKWMTNMDDELDEHCILCSEDYNSSCFRAAANINGNDWTDEIHDTVPASIKTRWNEIISFVMNSTDDEFVANLDSRIKVSTLIDRHIMGLYSCDYDGYGKNQLYITYDGQQWYADRYDKDGTWGNYWTGDSMLPSNYGRNQYEDMTSGRPGNLLFIRLEQLFYQRLQDRWEYLKVNELSIPNTINRFRELYDITPPYVIEEDYASTTANGAFSGIPNKTTCTIQQIEKFVVERHAWMDEYMASLTPEVEVPCTGISLNTNTLTFTAEGSQPLTATVTPDGCTDPVTWESDNISVATVSGGVVTAIANGSATITAKCGKYSASCSVAVSGIAEPVPCTGITLDKAELTFDGEGTQTITATVTPSDTTDSVVWVSSAPAVASISVEGNVCTVQSKRNGDAVITVTCGQYSAACSVSATGIIWKAPDIIWSDTPTYNFDYRTGEVVSNRDSYVSEFVDVEPGYTYLIYSPTGGDYMRAFGYTEDGTFVKFFGETTNLPVNILEDSPVRKIRLGVSPVGENIDLDTVTIVRGNTKWEFGAIEKTTGKDKNSALKGEFRTACYIPVNPGAKYRIEGTSGITWAGYVEYDSEYNFIVFDESSGASHERTVSENAGYVRLKCSADDFNVFELENAITFSEIS